MKTLTARLLRIALRIFAIGVTALATVWLVRGIDSRGMPDLNVWHSYVPVEEFRAKDYPNGISFADYQALELRLAKELDENIYSKVHNAGSEALNRYNKASIVYPGEAGQSLNRSFEIDTPDPMGGILLLHGASDSPYTMQALAQVFADNGLYVAVFRMPGHGSVPAGLKHARVDDWAAIVRSGVQHVAEKIGNDKPVYMAGYSTGAAVSIDYALDAALDANLVRPERLFLYSPAIAVTPFARFGSWDEALASIPYFEKLSWMSIETEYDPYKYNSFPKNGGYLSYAFSERVLRKLETVLDENPGAIPAMVTFQSLIDSTVRTDSVVHDLYQLLPDNGSELILFDINRADSIKHFVLDSRRELLAELNNTTPVKFSYTLVTNRSEHTNQTEARTRLAGVTETAIEELAQSWPGGVYSLSHVAVPFAPTDAWYGVVDDNGTPRNNTFSSVAPRGDQAILAIPLSRLMRLRYNPFFDYVESRTVEFCEACQSTLSADP
ncbi:MAG: alpha/beta hydrolase [Woeseiaceae bacterium]